MVLRLSSARARLTVVLVAFLLAAMLAYFSVRNALAAYDRGLQTRAGYERAARREPTSAENWFLVGRWWQYNLEESDARRAIDAYRTSLSLDPRAAAVWLDLATAYESQGELQAAREAYQQAKRVYPVSAEVSWRYGNFLLRQSELPRAFAEIRRAVSVDPQRAAEAFSRCWRVAPDIQAVLDQALPPSAPVYLDAIRELDADAAIDPALAVWDRLASLHPQLPLDKVIPFTDSLVQAHRIDDALRVWDQAVALAGPAPADPPGSVVWDGGFETGVIGGGFAWTIAPHSPGVQVTIDASEKHSGRRALRLGFDGSRNVDFSDVCHVVEVRPGTAYRFSAWVLAQNLTTDQGIRLRLEWLENAHNASTETPEVHGTQPWTELRLAWTAVAGIHQLRVCVNRHPSGDFSSRIHGVAWVDDVALVPESLPGEKP
jgi:tetratricopeptide (TPR) repeat protein